MNMKKVIAWMLLAGIAGVAGLGGCGSALNEEPEPETEQASPHSLACVNAQVVCMERCDKGDAGWGCSWCCRNQGVACTTFAGHDFYSCLK
jgi:hypothetical protein